MAPEIEAVLSRHEDELMDLPNVQGVGIGELDGERVIRVFVSRKVPKTSLAEQDVIPDELEGCRVCVDVSGEFSQQDG